MTRPSSDELIPWEAGAGVVGVGAFVGDDGEQTSFGEGSLELLSCWQNNQMNITLLPGPAEPGRGKGIRGSLTAPNTWTWETEPSFILPKYPFIIIGPKNILTFRRAF